MHEPRRVAHDRPTRFADTLFFALILLAVPPKLQAAEAPNTVPWRDDLATAQAEARARNLPLWIQFTGPWCINCRRMDRDAFTHARILAHARENFVPVKLRADAHESLALSLGLSALPATVIVRPGGEVIVAQQGYADACEFDSFLLAALARDGRPDRLLAGAKPPGGAGPGPGSAAARRLAASLAYGGAGDAGAALASVADRGAGDAAVASAAASESVAPDRVAGAPEPLPGPLPAMQGFCPVTLVVDHQLVPGREDLAVVHEGRAFRFADEARRDRFRAAPEAYAPAHGGRSPVSQVDRGEIRPGDPRWGILYRGWLFLCADAEERAEFLRDPERYARTQPADSGPRLQFGAHAATLVGGRPGGEGLGLGFGLAASALRAAARPAPDTRTR